MLGLCFKCGRGMPFPEPVYRDAFKDKLGHRGPCPLPPVETEIKLPETPISIKFAVRALCRVNRHVECSGATQDSEHRTANVCTCACHKGV